MLDELVSSARSLFLKFVTDLLLFGGRDLLRWKISLFVLGLTMSGRRGLLHGNEQQSEGKDFG